MRIPKTTIIPFEDRFTQAFERLNIEWLEEYFYVEDYDTHVLAHPRECILDKEGYIFMALIAEEPVGTVALIKRGEGVYELSKMGVTLKYQGMRIGQKLMYQAINFAGAHNFSRLFLDSNTILEPAIWLYRKVGFREIPVSKDTPYERCNFRMELWI